MGADVQADLDKTIDLLRRLLIVPDGWPAACEHYETYDLDRSCKWCAAKYDPFESHEPDCPYAEAMALLRSVGADTPAPRG